MTRHILTDLCRTLAGRATTRIVASEFSPALFPGLLKTTTLRLIVSDELCQFGREQFRLSRGLPTDGEDAVIALDDIPPSVAAGYTQTSWFECEDANPLCSRALFYDAVTGSMRAVGYDRNGRLRSQAVPNDASFYEDDEFLQGVADMRARMLSALFVLHEMPPECTHPRGKRLEIPFRLRDDAAKKHKPLFSMVRLRREFSDAITAAGDTKEQKTLNVGGRRWHFVRGHWMLPHGKTERVWRRFHWRGDPELGVVRKVYKVS